MSDSKTLDSLLDMFGVDRDIAAQAKAQAMALLIRGKIVDDCGALDDVLNARLDGLRNTLLDAIRAHGSEPQGNTPEELLPELLTIEREKNQDNTLVRKFIEHLVTGFVGAGARTHGWPDRLGEESVSEYYRRVVNWILEQE